MSGIGVYLFFFSEKSFVGGGGKNGLLELVQQ